MTDTRLLTKIKGITLILEAAATDGIPLPESIMLTAYGRPVLMVPNPAAVQEWATWLEGPEGTVTSYRGYDNPRRIVFHEYVGNLFDQSFKVSTSTSDRVTWENTPTREAVTA